MPRTAAFGLGVVVAGMLSLVPDAVAPAFMILILVFFVVFIYGDLNLKTSKK